MTFLVLSVLPAPDSPLHSNLSSSTFMDCKSCLRDEDTLILPFLAHIDPCSLGNGEDMGRILVSPFASILMYNCI